MTKLENPNKFMVWEQLIATGPVDLVETIGKVEGWLAFGWGLEQEEEEMSQYGSLALEDSCSSNARILRCSTNMSGFMKFFAENSCYFDC